MCRKLFLLTFFVLVFAFSMAAMASDIAFYVGQFNTDDWYDESQFTDVETIIAETGHLFNDIQQFNDDDLTFAAFNAWVEERTDDGKMDIIWLNGCTPSGLYPNPNELPDGSRIEAWLDGGNMVINVGDWFAYCTYEGGPRGGEGRGGDNGGDGAANILDLSSGIITGAGDTQLTVTPTGLEYLPSLNDPAKTDRPVVLAAVEAPWEVAAIFASTGGTEDPAVEAHADPVVIHNTETGGYMAFINQAAGGPDGWIDDRGLTSAEFIGNWVKNVVGLVDMEIGFAMQPPAIDGEVDGLWAAAATQSFVPLDDPANGSGTWKMLYDAENLYVIVDMTDDSLQNDSSSSWQDDSVEIYFDGGNTKLNTPLSGDDHQYTFGWTTDDIQGTNIGGYTEGIEHAQVTTDTGWRIEVKMPWMSIWGVVPQAGDLVGVDCYYNDDDDGGDSREGKMLSFSAVEGWNDASQWATAVLAVVPEPVDPGIDGLVAFYALDGDATDSSGNGIDGTIQNADTGGLGDGGSVWVDDPERGTVISFNGTAEGAFVRAGDIPQMTLTNDFTWSFWAKHSDENTADNDIILGNRMDENAVDFVPRQFIKFTPTKFEWHMNGNGDDNMEYDDIPADIWLHHAVVKTGDQLTYYRNGAKGGSGTIAQPLDFPQPLYFGGDNEGAAGENWSGLMSEVAIYDRALSAGEVRYLAGERAVDPSLVIYYDFDDVGEIVADQSGKGHDGVVVGDVTADANGKIGGAANFATGSYLDLDGPSIPAEDIPTSAMTLAAWIKIANTGGDHEIFSARASDESWLIHPEPKSSGDIRWLLRSYGGTTIFQIRAGTVTWDEWLHFAGTYDKESGKAALYINGELIEEIVVENPADIAGDWDLGARVGLTIDNGRPFTGLMDEFRMYKRALSQDEILTIMQGM